MKMKEKNISVNTQEDEDVYSIYSAEQIQSNRVNIKKKLQLLNYGTIKDSVIEKLQSGRFILTTRRS